MLTDAECRNVVCPAEKQQVRFSDSVGLYLQVSPGWSKRWFFKFRIGGVEKKLALGHALGINGFFNGLRLN